MDSNKLFYISSLEDFIGKYISLFSSYTLGNVNNVDVPWKTHCWTPLSTVFKWRYRLSRLIVLDTMWPKLPLLKFSLPYNTHSPSFALGVRREKSKTTHEKQIKSYTNSTNIEKNSLIKLDVTIRKCPWFWLKEYI